MFIKLLLTWSQKMQFSAGCWWFMPAILAIQEAEIMRMASPDK
jgi:hypothetical protein